jgi:proto-oncogene tyrosine-protein kinase ROS
MLPFIIVFFCYSRDFVNFRPNTQTPRFESIKSLSYANGLFYWTNGKDIIIEEYHKIQDTYYHNSLPGGKEKRYNTVSVHYIGQSLQNCLIGSGPPLDLFKINLPKMKNIQYNNVTR